MARALHVLAQRDGAPPAAAAPGTWRAPQRGGRPDPLLTQFVLSARGPGRQRDLADRDADRFCDAAVGGGQGAGSYHLHPGIFEEGSQGSVGHVPSLAGSSSVWERLSSRHPAAKRGGGAVGAGGEGSGCSAARTSSRAHAAWCGTHPRPRGRRRRYLHHPRRPGASPLAAEASQQGPPSTIAHRVSVSQPVTHTS